MSEDASSEPAAPEQPTTERILDATVRLLAREGISGVSMRAVSREAGVALGLANYHFDNKTELICAALRQLGERDQEIVTPDPDTEPIDALRTSLRRALDPEFLVAEYLGLRLQLWSLAGVDEQFAEINRTAQRRYLDALVDLIAAARPDLTGEAAAARAADVLTVQNGVWLTAILIRDDDAVARALERTEQIALA